MSGVSESRQLFPHGSITNLFSLQASAVFLMDYDEGPKKLRLLGLGHFVVYLIMQINCPILATVCSVDGFQWPLTKDTVILRMAKRTFAIALPGLLYGLQFPKSCDEVLIDTLERVFLKFGHYKNLNDTGLGYPLEDNEVNMWNKLRSQVETMAHQVLVGLGQLGGRSRFYIPNHNSCFLRAARMSATTKLIVDGMVRLGTLTGAHISIEGTNPSNEQQNTAYASVNAFGSLVDTVEAAWVMSSGPTHLLKDAEPPLLASCPNIGFVFWRLNEEGLVAFIHRLRPAAEREEQIMKEKEKIWKAKDKKQQAETYNRNRKRKRIKLDQLN